MTKITHLEVSSSRAGWNNSIFPTIFCGRGEVSRMYLNVSRASIARVLLMQAKILDKGMVKKND